MATLRRFFTILVFWFVANAMPASAEIARIDLNGPIDPITAEYLVKGIRHANAERVQFLLIRLQTPGGLSSSMEEIISAILASAVPVVVYVAPSGSFAASAGFFILMASDIAAMAPGTNTGAAHPLLAIGGFPVDAGSAGKTLADKITSNATAYLRSIATKRHRNVVEAEKAVTDSKSFTDAEALQNHLIDFVARDEGELLQQLQGYKVQLFSGTTVTLFPQGQTIVTYEMSSRERFLAALAQPNLALLLGVLGLILLYVEFSHPGAIAPGVIGGISLLLSILGFSFLPINIVGVLLILLAIALFIAEVKMHGSGILGLGGVAAMVFGMLVLIDSPDPAVKIGLAAALSAALPFAAIFILLLTVFVRSRRQRVLTGAPGMVGLIGVSDSEVFSEGRVRIRGEYWKAHSARPIAAGRRVRVVGIDNLTLNVDEVPD